MGEVDEAFIQAVEHRPKLTITEAEGIPLIDLSISNSNSIEALVEEIGDASKNWGFFQVINHGVPFETREKLELASRKFFAQATEEKLKVRRDEVNPLGYYETELTKNVRDWKEVYDLAVKNPTVIPTSPEASDNGLQELVNQWPEYPSELRALLLLVRFGAAVKHSVLYSIWCSRSCEVRYPIPAGAISPLSGYGIDQKGYRCYDPIAKKLRTSRHVAFLEHLPYYCLPASSSSVSKEDVLMSDPFSSSASSFGSDSPHVPDEGIESIRVSETVVEPEEAQPSSTLVQDETPSQSGPPGISDDVDPTTSQVEIRVAYEEDAKEMEKLAYKLLELISLSLGLPANRLSEFFNNHTSISRLNHYPTCPIPNLALGVGRHKDGGALIILAQDDVGGLQVKRKTDGEWVQVRPTPHAYIVNVGDIIQVWSNERYESVEHRVMVNSEKERFSMRFSFNPNHDVMVEPLEELITEQNPAKYRAYNWGKFFANRRRSNFKKLGVENIQISHFKITEE
ncbi:hypothetical protein RHGRI_032705 [Rhododendron griersonianum]|uniref:Fe2OG dioxygenase domain-containing protein n=1 Tax=Rhododendron griersonianum TaxID=479676 RepID=A0AAV6ICZ2_9ERIC|nr:hypothetical protein RHGRI_032705 [Rhododendron griersonianum]